VILTQPTLHNPFDPAVVTEDKYHYGFPLEKTLPTLEGQWNGYMRFMEAAVNSFNEGSREVARDLKAPLVDLERRLGPDPSLFESRDPIHLNAAGAAAAEEAIREAVLPFIPSEPPTVPAARSRPVTDGEGAS